MTLYARNLEIVRDLSKLAEVFFSDPDSLCSRKRVVRIFPADTV